MTEYESYKSIGICPQCRKHEAEPNHVLCYECLDEKRQKWRNSEHKKRKVNSTIEKRKESGICTRCGKRDASDGKLKCRFCLAKERNKQRERRNTTIPRCERTVYGYCYICGKTCYKDSKLCKEHYDKAVNNVTKGRMKSLFYKNQYV